MSILDRLAKSNQEIFHTAKNNGSLRDSFANHIKYSLFKDKYSTTKLDLYKGIALSIRDRLVEKWVQTQQAYYKNDVKRVYYLSMEYLLGRALTHYLVNLDLEADCRKVISELGHSLEELEEMDLEAGLGNGGLGRLAVCFLEALASLDMPAHGYGIRYEFGIFYQKILNGFQVESADNWLRQGNPWEIPRPEHLLPIKFYGRIKHITQPDGTERYEWVDTHDDVMAMAYDIPLPGYKNNTVNNLRLWATRSTREFDFHDFNAGDYIEAVRHKQETETISKVLYPNDIPIQGKELRLKQEYFFVSASIQDIVRRYKKTHAAFDAFPDKIAIQLNDTHPALGIPELMRILMDRERLSWEKAWEITVNTFAYTNHTILPEALEKWSVDLMGRVLPRHLHIIYEINRRFLEEVKARFPKDPDRLRRMSLIEERPIKSVRMAHLAIVGSHAVNGVAALHSEIIKTRLFRDFYEMYPTRFLNITNGISQRHWLKGCNPGLAGLITEKIGAGWVNDLSQLERLLAYREDEDFRRRWEAIKTQNKHQLADWVQRHLGLRINAHSLFDVHIKRIHEYKRQLLNILHVVTLYNRIKKEPHRDHLPRTVIFSGKAAPGYAIAKLIIKLINGVGKVVNTDPEIGDRLKVIFVPNYSVALAELIIPAADLSQQISTAGMEASGTGNMKLALNGALTLGTLDGANVEIREEVGDENIYIFGLRVDEVTRLKKSGYRPRDFYLANKELKQAIDMINEGFFSPEDPALFHPIIHSLLNKGDFFMVLADFESYAKTHLDIEEDYRDSRAWSRKAITNTACMGKFSSDRAIGEYAEKIWNIKPLPDLYKIFPA